MAVTSEQRHQYYTVKVSTRENRISSWKKNSSVRPVKPKSKAIGESWADEQTNKHRRSLRNDTRPNTSTAQTLPAPETQQYTANSPPVSTGSRLQQSALITREASELQYVPPSHPAQSPQHWVSTELPLCSFDSVLKASGGTVPLPLPKRLGRIGGSYLELDSILRPK